MAYYVGLDLGTSGCKAGVIEVGGRLKAAHQREYRFAGNELWAMECDAELVWNLSAECVRRAVADSGVDPREIKAIGLSVLGEAAMPVDEHGKPLRPGIHALDSRGGHYGEYVNWWRERFGPLKVFQVTSYPLSFLPTVMKMMWVRDHEPELFKRAYKYCTFQDFTVWKLAGAPAIDYAMASRTMLFDVVNHRWSREFLEAAGISEELLSPAYESTAQVGEVTEVAARATGLRPGTAVVVGCSDQAAAAVAVGAVREGVVMNGAGSSEAIGTPTRHPLTSEDMMLRGQGSQCHVRRDLWLALGFHLTCGHLVKWTRDQLGQLEKEREARGESNAYDLITTQAATSPPGANGVMVLPHFLGSGTGHIPCLEPASRGTILGLTVSRSKADIFRAIFEGMNYEVRLILESLEQAGIAISELKVSGGGAKSPFWLQLKADITQKKVTVPAVTEASLFGAGILAATGVGLYSSLEDAVDRTARDVAEYHPNQDLAATYDRHYQVYKELYTGLLPINRRIQSLTGV